MKNEGNKRFRKLHTERKKTVIWKSELFAVDDLLYTVDLVVCE